MDAMIAHIKQAAAMAFEHDERVRLAYLYGSVARGQARPESDVDIGVVLNGELAPADQLAFELTLERALADAGVQHADVRTLNTAPLLLQGEALADGILLFARDDDERIAYEAGTRSRYFDYLPAARHMAQTFAQALAKRLDTEPVTEASAGEWPA